MIPLKERVTDYYLEHLSIGSPASQLQITSKCNAKCIFCSNEQNPFKITRLPFRELEDIKQQLWGFPLNYYGSIALNESLPGRISEGEAFLHPQLFEILEYIRSFRPNVIRITTNGSFLTEEMVSKLSKYKPIQLSISFHSTVSEMWCKILQLPEDKFRIALESFELLKKYDLLFDASIVTMPNLTGYDDLEKTITFLSKYTKQLRIWSPGYTNYTNPDIVEYLKFDEKELSQFLEKQRNTIEGLETTWSLDKSLILELPLDLLNSKLLEGKIHNIPVVFLVSEAAHDRIKNTITSLAGLMNFDNFKVLPVKNLVYGGNICCSGLWMVSDVCEVLNLLSGNELVILPRVFLDKEGFDLQGNSVITIYNKYPKLQVFFV